MRHASLSIPVVVLSLAFATPVLGQSENALPQGEGRDMVASGCSQCHGLAPITSLREGAAGWRRHVYNMVLRGAQLRESETETVIRYLAVNFGPSGQAVSKVDLPTGAGRDLVEARCSTCHDLERVAGVKRQKQDWAGVVANMVTRGAVATPDEARAMAAYLATHFGTE